jgi:endoglucanase
MAANRILCVVCALCGLSHETACLSSPSANRGPAADGGPLASTSSCSATPPATAPSGYFTSGGVVCTTDAKPHSFHGVDRPSLEWSPSGVNVSKGDFTLMAGWGANVVRIALNQDFWLGGAALYDAGYEGAVDQAILEAEASGLDVILDLHWSDCGDSTVTSMAMQQCGNSNQQVMADANSIEFWKEVADKYKRDGRVLFELYNEPHGISWDVWLHGGSVGSFRAAGMQELYDAIRATGASNTVIAGGLDWAYDLSGVGASGYSISGYNVMYATHVYSGSGGSAPTGWESSFGHLETSDFAPVIVTEFGDTRSACNGDWDTELIAFADSHDASWTAWAWYPGVSATDPQGCHFPALITDWSGTPTAQGVAVRAALAAYGVPNNSSGPQGSVSPTDAAAE